VVVKDVLHLLAIILRHDDVRTGRGKRVLQEQVHSAHAFGPGALLFDKGAQGLALRSAQWILRPAFGLTGALLPIAAQNYGAGHYDRVREATMICFKAGVALMLAGSCVLWFAAGPAMALFTQDERVIEIGKSYLHIDGFILPVYVPLFAITSLLQALKKPIYTLLIGIYRQGIGVALFSWIYVHFFDLGYLGIWIGIATAVTTGLMLSLALTERVARELIGGLFTRAPATRAA
jgi:Na+-driven multidrug efflux pump